MHYEPYLRWIDHQKREMELLVERFANMNTHSRNLAGLEEFRNEMKSHLLQFGGELQELNMPPQTHVDEKGKKVTEPLGKALFLTLRPKAPIKVFLCGHMDTVYSQHSNFQRATRIDPETLLGPGVADMKGGLVIMLTALRAFEKSPYAEKIGFEILLTPDEEIGSPGSRGAIERCAKRNDIGLIFEPSFSDGALVSKRGGSSYFTVVAKGIAAHAGRDFHEGSSAIFTLFPVLQELQRMNSDQLIVNVGEIHGGTAANTVPDVAILQINMRSMQFEVMKEAEMHLSEFVKKDARLELHKGASRLPKVLDAASEKLLYQFLDTAATLGMTLEARETRGVSDGNIVSECGLPVVDTLGAVGGKLHSHDEFLKLESLTERAKLTALFLMKLATGEYSLEDHQPPPQQIELP